MKKLSLETFGSFVDEADISVIMFGSPTGDATREQAIEFVDAWITQPDIAFGYVDAFEQVALSRSLGIRVLPTTIVLRDGDLVVRYEGRHPMSALRDRQEGSDAKFRSSLRGAEAVCLHWRTGVHGLSGAARSMHDHTYGSTEADRGSREMPGLTAL